MSDVIEAMARAIWTTYTNSEVAKPDLRGITWDDLLRWAETSPRMAKLVELGRDEARAAIRALPDGWVVTEVGEEMDHMTAGTQSGPQFVTGHNVCRAAVLARAVRP